MANLLVGLRVNLVGGARLGQDCGGVCAASGLANACQACRPPSVLFIVGCVLLFLLLFPLLGGGLLCVCVVCFSFLWFCIFVRGGYRCSVVVIAVMQSVRSLAHVGEVPSPVVRSSSS